MNVTPAQAAAVKEIMHESAPAEITHQLLEFCREISPATPVFVDVRPADQMIQDECFDNVAKHVAANGGSSVMGWTIWQSQIFLHAECHCNWMSTERQLLDITPKQHAETRTLFLADDTVVYQGFTIPSRRKGRFPSEALDALIHNHAKRDAIRAAHSNGVPMSHPDGQRFEHCIVNGRYLELEVLADFKRWSNSTPA